VETERHFEIFGISLLNNDLGYLLAFIEQSLGQNKRVSFATPNIDHFVRIEKNTKVKRVYQSIDYCVNDSRIFGLIIKFLFGTTVKTVTGSDLTAHLFNSPVIKDTKITIVGSKEEEIRRLSDIYNLDLGLISHINPSMNFINDEVEVKRTLEFVVNSKPALVFLAVGSPQQEILAANIQREISQGIILCVGASIDYLTGKERRAPKFLQVMYLEWLFRFAQAPVKRFKRYFVNCPQIIYYVLRERLKAK
jgi:exopolysaccharide biosynthesis WecB/TagA/CpsF family protein